MPSPFEILSLSGKFCLCLGTLGHYMNIQKLIVILDGFGLSEKLLL